jgi:hypothetical protein
LYGFSPNFDWKLFFHNSNTAKDSDSQSEDDALFNSVLSVFADTIGEPQMDYENGIYVGNVGSKRHLPNPSVASNTSTNAQEHLKKKRPPLPRKNSKTLKKLEVPAPSIVIAVGGSTAAYTKAGKNYPSNDVPVVEGFLAPPPIPPNDPRRNLCKIVMNAFHSCDIKKLKDTLEQYCSVPNDIVEVHRYEGMLNPHGRDYSRMEGMESILQLWTALFKSAPDFCFELFNHQTYYDPDWKVVVTCDFHMCGTRIIDVKVSQPVNEEEQDICGSATTSSGSDSGIVPPSTSSSMKTKEESLFEGKGLVISSASTAVSDAGNQDQSTKIYVDTVKTLKQPCKLSYKGKFTVFLNEAQKINKIDFVYTEMEEKMIGVPVAVYGKSVTNSTIIKQSIMQQAAQTSAMNRGTTTKSYPYK